MFIGSKAYLFNDRTVVINKSDIENAKPEEFKEILLCLSEEFITNNYEKIQLTYEGLTRNDENEDIETDLEKVREWFLRNYKPAISDLIETTIIPHGKVNEWDDVSVAEMLEELHFELKDGILKVIDSYLKEGRVNVL